MIVERWTALVMAGQRPGPDMLAGHFGVAAKALVPVAEEAMLSRVVRTLLATPEIGRVVIVAQAPEMLTVGDCAWLAGESRVVFDQGSDGISANVARLAGSAAAPWPVLVTTADHPLLTPEIIAGFIAGSTSCDLAIGMVERAVLLGAYPDNRRTWIKLSDGAWSGANLFALRSPKVGAALRLWSAAEQDRKRAAKLFLRFGPWLALRLFTRTIGLGAGLRLAGARMGLTAKLVSLAQPEAAIDVDKLSDHALAQAILLRGGR